MKDQKASEAVFSGRFENILDVLFEGFDIKIRSGENVCQSTCNAISTNDTIDSGFGRRIDILMSNVRYNVTTEYCAIEFKKQAADRRLLSHQQSKNIRVNGSILNDLSAKCKDNDIYLVYMDWWGVDGYIAGISRYNDINIVDQIATLHIPVDCIEIDDFRDTVRYLYRLREHILKQSQIVALSIFKEKRKYAAVETSTPSTPSTPICHSPERSPVSLPLDIYYSPSKRNKTGQ